MSTARGAKLKAQYNRVRTSTALRANDMWTNTIGMEANPQAGSNAAIEAAIYAPTHGGGGANRAQRRELAQQLIQATGYQPSVTDYQGLLTLAKEQGSLGAGTRGACKLCGGMGHTTKQCTNFLTGHNAVAGVDVITGSGAAGAAVADRGLLPDPEALNLSDLDTSSGGSSSAGSSESDSESERERRRSKKRKRSRKEKSSSSSRKDRKEKRDRKHSKKSKKSSKESSRSSKRQRRSESGTESD